MPKDAVLKTAERGRRALLLPLLAAALSLAGCVRTVNDYLREAGASNSPGAVKDAVISIGQLLYRKEATGIPFDEADREAITYLKEVATSNPVPVNRAVALRALGQLQGGNSTEVIRKGLKDPFWMVRLEAVQVIALRPDPSYAEPLRDLYSSETRAEVRLEIVKALRKVKGPVALRTLLEVFLRKGESPADARVHAYSGIVEMTGLSYGFDDLSEGWKKYYREQYGALPSDEAPVASDPRAPPSGAPAAANVPKETDRKSPPAEKGPGR